ncbi:helix-turn-helix domain-containing protein [Deefgea tanakiae]|uniref:Helix-turn-helix domain-containing protein n=1 Tax=Deefgea tanakiae TaxID=2865840 RepID=A0ABX8Z8M1_9NEIS|nr:helix-turn-helix domain-containing protein [Deefgea tanakiae]QZA78924.1 helix-turn-helix domain-containing protein [Deefgea tanakiae]
MSILIEHNKPERAYERIKDAIIQNQIKPQYIRNYKPEPSNSKNIYFITGGEITIMQNNVILYDLAPPEIIGLLEYYRGRSNLYYSVPFFYGYKIDFESWEKMCEQHDLWKATLEVMAYSTSMYEMRSQHFIDAESYIQVKYAIEELIKLNDNIRADIKLIAYTAERTNLSKSLVQKIIFALKQGDYIIVENGKLIKVNKNLPNGFNP